MIRIDYRHAFLDISYVNNLIANRPYEQFVIEVENTSQLSLSQLYQLDPRALIRIDGGYNMDRVMNRPYGTDYYNSVIYSRNETILIMEEIESITKGINPEWDDMHRFLYVYDTLKRKITYHPNYLQMQDHDIRSLRGLISKKTVCAGYAIILKEILDYIGISCDYIEGMYYCSQGSGCHAWNLVTIDGKTFPVDLTSDSKYYHCGLFDGYFLGQNINEFNKSHVPGNYDKGVYNRRTFAEPDFNKVVNVVKEISKSREYELDCIERDDHSLYALGQIGVVTIDNKQYMAYYYADVNKNGQCEYPRIVYTGLGVNLSRYFDEVYFGRQLPKNYFEEVKKIFNKENVSNAKNYHNFLGEIVMDEKNETAKAFPVNNAFSASMFDKLAYSNKEIKRSNGTSLMLIKRNIKSPLSFNNKNIYTYEIYESYRVNNRLSLKRDIIYTEMDLDNIMIDNKLADILLNRQKLDYCMVENGGYIGYFDYQTRKVKYDCDIINAFKTSVISQKEKERDTQNLLASYH